MSTLPRNEEFVAKLELMAKEEKQAKTAQRQTLIKDRNVDKNELRLKNAQLLKENRILKHELTMKLQKIEKMKNQHQRRLTMLQNTYQRRLAAQLSEAQEISESDDQGFCQDRIPEIVEGCNDPWAAVGLDQKLGLLSIPLSYWPAAMVPDVPEPVIKAFEM